MHLVTMHVAVNDFDPSIVVVDPATALLNSSTQVETRVMLLRLVDFLKGRQITSLMTTLTGRADGVPDSETAISSLVDTWILLREIEVGGERNRGVYILKSRGTAHSNQVREFLLTNHGVQLREVYPGADGVFTGSARLAQEAKAATEGLLVRQEIERQQWLRERKRKVMEAQIAALQFELETEDQQARQTIAQQELRLRQLEANRDAMIQSRSVNASPAGNDGSTGDAGGRG
jgi:circadian clock protein KaiC